ncbi:hypothetical protein AB1Y20_013161 [Prymnesium parvum]|uniref:Coenzyme Q-binding protein COQ10 START domain-containing protein n=1 Tax=Prymnesium parvum TaxID=97485 RepID=A0AB34ILZ7_PRYPA
MLRSWRGAPLLRPAGCARARAFLPGLSSSRHDAASHRRSHKWQRVVQFPVDTIYGVVADVESYSQFLPWCLSSRVVRRTEGVDGSESMEAHVRVGFMLMQSQFSSTVTLSPRKRVVAVSRANEHLEELSFSWDFAPLGEEACRLDLKLDFCLRSPEHGQMWDLVREKVISDYLQAFQQRCADLGQQKRA